MGVVDASLGYPLAIEEKASMPFAGGIANKGHQCGMLWGAALATGAQAHRLYGPGPQAQAEALVATQGLVEIYRGRTEQINCRDVTGLDMQTGNVPIMFLLKGGPIYCFLLAARYARGAFAKINAAFSERQVESLAPPVSCAAMLAEKMGASELHTAMVAGFAGGIGLSGGACGVLGAAIWLTGLTEPAEPVGISYETTWVKDKIEQFLESSGDQFECANIVGRRFADISDHSEYLRAAGCADIIAALA
jgi:hypothetical protein